MKFYHILGPVMAIVAMLFWATAMVKREKGKEVDIWPRLLLIGGVIFFHLFFTDVNIWDKIALLTLDFGIGMIVNTAYLAYHKAYPKVFFGLGMTALVISGAVFGVSHMLGWAWMKINKSDAQVVMVELGPDDDIKELNPILSKYNANFEEAFPMVEMDEDEDLAQFYKIYVAPEEAEEFLREVRGDKENVDFAEMNVEIKLEPEESKGLSHKFLKNTNLGVDDPYVADQWWLNRNYSPGMYKMLDKMDPEKKAIVAILDTGVDSDHEDLESVWSRSPGKKDKHGHGTHCAALAGGATNNGKGVASLNYEGKFVEIRGYQALGDNGSGDLHSIGNAIIQAAEDGADVISMSLGGYMPNPPRTWTEAISYARSLGCIVVCAAGNSYDDAKNHAPTNIDGVISVAAIDSEGNKAEFSNTNTSLKWPISAPGVDIYSAIPGGEYAPMSGTSMATPIVSGLIGLMRAVDPDITDQQAYDLLRETGNQPQGQDQIGYLVRPDKVVEALYKRAG